MALELELEQELELGLTPMGGVSLMEVLALLESWHIYHDKLMLYCEQLFHYGKPYHTVWLVILFTSGM
jgi:hypothetical protein